MNKQLNKELIGKPIITVIPSCYGWDYMSEKYAMFLEEIEGQYLKNVACAGSQIVEVSSTVEETSVLEYSQYAERQPGQRRHQREQRSEENTFADCKEETPVLRSVEEHLVCLERPIGSEDASTMKYGGSVRPDRLNCRSKKRKYVKTRKKKYYMDMKNL